MEYIDFGKIVNTHALKGEIKIYSYTDNETNILNLKNVYIDGIKYIVEKSRFQKGMFVMKLKGVDCIEQAERLVGLSIMREIKEEEKTSENEFFVKDLEGIVSAFLELAENRARRHIPMTMEDWVNLIDKYLLLDNRDILKDAGKISHEIACDKALTEFEKYRIRQDKLYKSYFDLLLEESGKKY